MTKFHAVMLDETRCEFGAEVSAKTRDEAYRKLAENYPESRCVQLESPADTRHRKQRQYERAEREYNDEYFNDGEDY